MKKLILFILVCFSICSSAQAQVIIGNSVFGNTVVKNGVVRSSSILNALLYYPGLVNFKSFKDDQTTVNEDFAAGTSTMAYTQTRSATAPDTYVDASCNYITSTTSHVALYDKCYYDTTGPHVKDMGLHIWGNDSNLLVQSSKFDDAAWVATNMTVASDGTGVDGGASYSLTATNNNATVVQAFTGKTSAIYTGSIHIKRKTGTGIVRIRSLSTDSYTDITSYVTSGWTRVKVSSSSATTAPSFDIQLATSGDSVYVSASQLEPYQYMTAYMPTTTVSVSRGAPVLRGTIQGNMSKNEMTVIVKVTPGGASFFNEGRSRNIFGTDVKQRYVQKTSDSGLMRARANVEDSPSAQANSTTTLQANTSYVVAAVFKHSSPYVIIYVNGILEASYTTADWINNAWGTRFTLGTDNGGGGHFNGNFEYWSVYNSDIGASAISAISTLFANN